MLQHRRLFEMGEYFQSLPSKWEDAHGAHDSPIPHNRLLVFCDLILKYEKYKDFQEDNDSSSGSDKTNDSFSSENEDNKFLSKKEKKVKKPKDKDNEAWNHVSCYCMKPFKGRPMIECNMCETWIHMSCAKIRPSNVPEIFTCQFCQEPKSSQRRSGRRKSDEKLAEA